MALDLAGGPEVGLAGGTDGDVRTLHDAAGSAFGEDMYRSAKEGQISEVVFKSPVPGSTEHVSKQAYVAAIGDQICGVSSYLGKQ